MSPLVLAACLALLAGPAVHALLPRAHAWESALDGFALAVVLALCMLHLLPEAIAGGGPWALLAAVAGFFLLARLEKAGAASSGSALLVGGLVLHAFVEGLALATLDGGSGLGVAVIAHRLPVGLLAWLAMERHGGARWGMIGVLGLGAATVAGALLPVPHEVLHDGAFGAFLPAFVAGTLLHVVLDHGLVWGGAHAGHDHDHGSDPCCDDGPADQHAHHDDHGHDHGHDHHDHGHDDHGHDDHDHAHPAPPSVRWAAIGAVTGLAVVMPMFATPVEHAEHGHGFLDTLYSLTLTSAPALLAGFVLAGLLTGLMGEKASSWIGRGGVASQATRGVVFGLPLPVCSCGVLPMYEALIRRGVPAAAAMAFLVATPELGLDAILLSLPLLGAELTVARVVGAFAIALAAGIVVGRSLPTAAPAADSASDTRPLGRRITEGLRYGLVELFDHTIPWVLIGLVVAALAEPLLEHPLLAAVPHMAQVPLFAAIGIPVYVCASGATPLAAVAIFAGVGPGAAIAFLLSGPATNVTTFGILSNLHGRATAIQFGLTVGVGAILLGWSVDALGLTGPAGLVDAHEHGVSTVALMSTAALGAMLVASLFRQGPRGMVQQVAAPLE